MTAILPFWQRLRAISLYPFQSAALYTVIVLTVLIAVGGLLPVVGFLLILLSWLAALKYAFEILLTTANGQLEAPESVLGIGNSVVWSFLVLQIVSVFVPMIVAMAASVELGTLLLWLIMFLQPAAIMALGMTQSLLSALDPSLWLRLVTRIGWPYLALVGLLLVIQYSAANATGLLGAMLPAVLAEPLITVFALWALFATFHLMGYLLWQYHEALGFEPTAPERVVNQREAQEQQLQDAVTQAVQGGDIASALRLIREELRSRALPIPLHDLYRRLLRQQGDQAALLEHGRLFMHLLLVEKQDRRALGLARECLDLDAHFTAPDIEDSIRLAERAAQSGQSSLAVDLLLAAVHADSRHPEMPRWTWRAVDLLLRQPGREAQALSLLDKALPRCDDPALRDSLEGLRRSLAGAVG